jgi:hypothetical protein
MSIDAVYSVTFRLPLGGKQDIMGFREFLDLSAEELSLLRD